MVLVVGFCFVIFTLKYFLQTYMNYVNVLILNFLIDPMLFISIDSCGWLCGWCVKLFLFFCPNQALCLELEQYL